MNSGKIDMIYKQAYSEVSKVLEFLPKNEYDKIPTKFINLIEENKLDEYKYDINSVEELNKDKLLPESQAILLVIYNTYLASEEEKKIIEEKLIENEKKYLEELNEKYNPDNIFKKKEEVKNEFEEMSNRAELPIEYHESVFNKIISFIKRIFFKRR